MSFFRRATSGAARALLLGGALVWCTAVWAQGCTDAPDYSNCPEGGERWEPDWREDAVSLPPPPAESDLVTIEAPRASTGYRYLLDRASIARGSDGVMRYTVVVESSSGARNVFYEGLRCETDQVKTYAYATQDGTFRPVARNRWKAVAVNGVRAYQDYLKGVVLCTREGFAWDADKARRALSRQYTAGGVRIERFCKDCEYDAEMRAD